MDAPPKRELVDWVVSEIGATPRFVPCGWPQSPSRVWRLELDSAPLLFLKEFAEERKRQQEITALEGWVETLAADDTRLPSLRAASPVELSSVLLTTVPGDVGANLPLDEHAGIEVHRNAGTFLARLHTLPFVDEDPMPLSVALPLRLAFWLERGGDRLSFEEGVIARDLVGDGSLFAGDTRVPCHRDYQLRNWLVGRTRGREAGERATFGVIDFEHARPDHPGVDFVRVEERAAPHYPSWFEAFLASYELGVGKRLDREVEEAKRRALSAIHAVGSVVWGSNHGDDEFERAGHTLLERLAVEVC